MRIEDPSNPWPRDDRYTVEEMLSSPHSEQWTLCHDFVGQCIARNAKLPDVLKEDVVQDVMISIQKSLPAFEYRCSLKTWLIGIANNRIVDTYRRQRRTANGATYSLDESFQRIEQEATIGSSIINSLNRTEAMSIEFEELQEALAMLREYINIHANSVRNRQILQAVILEGRSLQEAAEIVGCSAPVVGYVVRSAQRYLREKRKQKS
jgi:RNA polymerase sigma factor (sigma-70 family)